MRTLLTLALAAATALAVPFAAQAEPQLTKAQAEILAAEQGELAGWQTRNLDKIMNAYTPDTQVITGDAPVRDHTALRTAFIRFLADPGFSLTFRSDPAIVAASGDIGISPGSYEVTATDPATRKVVKSAGFHLLLWRKEKDGAWRILRQLTTPSPHAAPSGTAAQ